MKVALAIIALVIATTATDTDTQHKYEIDFLEGFMNGIGLENLYTCIEQMLEEKVAISWLNQIRDVIKQIPEIRDPKQIVNIYSELIAVLELIHQDAIHCFVDSAEITRLFNLIKSLTPVKLFEDIKRMITQHKKIFEEIKSAVMYITKKNFYEAGYTTASILNQFLFDTFSVNPLSEAYLILDGILLGLKQDQEDVDELLECVGDIEYIKDNITDGIKDLKIIIADVKNFNFGKLLDIIKCFEKIFADLRNVFIDMEPCAQSNKDIMKLISIFKNKTLKQIAEHIAIDCLKNAYGVFTDLKDAVNYYEQARYLDFGMKIGDVLYKTLLQA